MAKGEDSHVIHNRIRVNPFDSLLLSMGFGLPVDVLYNSFFFLSNVRWNGVLTESVNKLIKFFCPPYFWKDSINCVGIWIKEEGQVFVVFIAFLFASYVSYRWYK